jgi:hypothetical protein
MADVHITPAPEAERIGRECIAEWHRDLSDEDAVRILYLFTDQKRTTKGKTVLAKTTKLSPRERYLASSSEAVDAGPHYVIEFGLYIWAALSEAQRRALVDHELCHIELTTDDDGNPVYGLRAHEIEEFSEIVERHGLWSAELRHLAETAGSQLTLL